MLIYRVGPFNLTAEGKYVVYKPELSLIQELSQQPEGYQVSAVGSWESTTSGSAPFYIDPARGVLLNIFTNKASLEDRLEAGGTFGYIILALLALGMLIAVERLITLTIIGGKVNSQRKNIDNPGNNPLGRILKVYQSN